MQRFKKVVSLSISLCFIINTLLSNYVFAASVPLNLPAAGQLLPLSAPSAYTVLRGMRINPKDPLKFEFVIDKPADKSVDKEEFRRLVSYFMAALTIPEKDFWVNLSPYEKNRIIPAAVADTDFGRDLLTQDYVLKQVSASLTYPESELGKQYWQKVYAAAAKAGIKHDQAVNAFSKVWIVPENVEVFEDGNLALVGEARLKVLSQADYTAMDSSLRGSAATKQSQSGIATPREASARNDAAAKIMREMLIPALTKEVNTGANFTQLRQMFHSFALALWFKNKLKDSFFKYYINQNKTKGIDLSDKTIKDKVYNQYVDAFKQGVYNMIKKEPVGANNHSPVSKITKRQYFSGGVQVYVPGAFTVLALKNADGAFNHKLPPELLAKLQVKEIAGDDRVMEAYFLDIIAHWQHMGWDVNKLTPGLLKELYRAHSLPADPNDPVGRNTRKLLIAVHALTANNNYKPYEAEAIAKNLASEEVHLLGVRSALILGLVALSCSNAVRSNGDASDASTITAPAEDAGVVPASDVIPSQGGQADTANPVGGASGTGGAIGTGGVTGAGGSLATGGATGTGGTPEDAGVVPASDVLPSQDGQSDTTTVGSKPGTITLGYGSRTQEGFVIMNSGSASVGSDPQNPNSISISASLKSDTDWGNAFMEFSSPRDFSGYTLKVTVVSTNGMQGLYVYDIPKGADPSSIGAHRDKVTITGFKAGAVYEIPLNNATNTWHIVFEAGQYYGTGNPIGSSSASLTLELVPNDAGANGSGSVDSGSAKKSGTPYKDVTDNEKAAVARAVVKERVRLLHVARKAIVVNTKMLPNRRGFHIPVGLGETAIALNENLSSPEIKAYVKQHEINEINIDYGTDSVKITQLAEKYASRATGEGSFRSRVVHMLVAAAERAQWIKDGKDGLLAVDDEDLRGYDKPALDGLSKEERDLQRAIIQEFYGKGSEIDKNSAAYEAKYKETARRYGGVDLAKTKIIKHVLGAPVKVEVSPKVVEEFKNAKSVGFEILSLGDKFVLR